MRTKTISYAFLSFLITVQSVLLTVAPTTIYAEEVVVPPQETTTEPYLIISAVQITGGTGKTHEDFIELYNPTAQPFDLNGHRLVKRTATGITDTTVKAWTEETIVQAYHFYLWANSNFTTIPVAPDSTTSATLADNNGIALREGGNDVGVILDTVAWGSSANGFDNKSAQNPSANESLVREDLFSESIEFKIEPSNARNSLVTQLPPITEEEPVEEEPIEEEPPVEDPPAEEPPVDEEETAEEEPQNEEEQSEEVDIKITELLPNPNGTDSGTEKIELYNAGNTVVNLEGYKIDDVSDNEGLSSNAYVLPDLDLTTSSYITITIPTGKFALNNTNGDVVSLFNSNNELLDSVFYEGSTPEAKSYSYFSSGWEWADSTFGIANGQPPEPEEEESNEESNDEADAEDDTYDNSGLEISEIFPQPPAGTDEFVEIYNAGEETAQLSHVAIYVGDRKKLLPEYVLEPGKYFVIEQSALPVQLRNSGQTIKLQQNTTVLSTVTYPLAMEYASFAKFEDGFLWTKKITKSEPNLLEIPESVKKVAIEKAKTTTAKKTTAAAKTSAKTTTAKSTVAKATTTNPTNKPSEPTTAANGEAIESETQKKQKESLGKIIAMGAAAVTAGVVALYKLVFTSGVE